MTADRKRALVVSLRKREYPRFDELWQLMREANPQLDDEQIAGAVVGFLWLVDTQKEMEPYHPNPGPQIRVGVIAVSKEEFDRSPELQDAFPPEKLTEH